MHGPQYAPLYSIPECARYLGLPAARVRSWVTGSGDSGPLIQAAGSEPTSLSFVNLVELHVLAALRQRHKVPMQRIRPAIDALEDRLGVHHPLARRELLTDGLNVFTEHLGQLLNLSRGQFAIRVMEAYLDRVEHDSKGIASRFYPFSRGDELDAPKLIAIDPTVSFGRPVIFGTGVRASVVANFFKGGESIADLADEYRLDANQIEEAVRYELAA